MTHMLEEEVSPFTPNPLSDIFTSNPLDSTLSLSLYTSQVQLPLYSLPALSITKVAKIRVRHIKLCRLQKLCVDVTEDSRQQYSWSLWTNNLCKHILQFTITHHSTLIEYVIILFYLLKNINVYDPKNVERKYDAFSCNITESNRSITYKYHP